MWHTHEYDTEYSYPKTPETSVYLTKEQFKNFLTQLGFLKDKKGQKQRNNNFLSGSHDSFNYFSTYRSSPEKSP
jgi:hypothetical protein